MKGPARFQGEIITESENTSTKFKKNLLQNRWTYVNQIWHKTFLGEGDSRFTQMKGPALSEAAIINK